MGLPSVSKRDGLTKGLAGVGTVLIWIPIVLPVLFGALRYASARLLRVDYLMPGELFPIVAVGAVLLLWSAIRARAQRKLVGWTAGIGAVTLVVSQAVAIATGLASGDAEPDGWTLALVLGLYAIYPLAVIALGVGGVRLLRVVAATQPSGPPESPVDGAGKVGEAPDGRT